MRESAKSSPIANQRTVLLISAILAGAIFFRAGITRSQERLQITQNQSNQFEIKSSVNLVVLHLMVRDHQGALAQNLTRDNFDIYEDEIRQQVESFSREDIPMTLGLVIDNSSSMKTKRADVIAASLGFAHASNPKDEMFVVNFNDTVSFGLPKELPFTDRPARLEQALTRNQPDGKTALYDAISYALAHLKDASLEKKALIVISDGGDNASQHTLSEVKAEAIKSDAMIYAIGLFDADDLDRNPNVLKQLATATGGEAFLPDTIKDIESICQRIALEIRGQYAVAYESTNKKQDGTYRSIRVKINAPERLTVRARAGYYAPLSPDPASLAEGKNR